MENKLIVDIKKGILITAITLSSLLPSEKAIADGIYKGMRGPTNWQLDSRITYSKNEERTKTITGNLILKYWDGNEFGWFGFFGLPYKNIDAPSSSLTGFGDISLGGGPRGKLDNFHCVSYIGFTLPSGDEESKPALGAGRIDTKIGLLGTYLTDDKKYELDGIVERNFTGKNNSGINPPDETYVGLVAGRELTKKLRFVTGPTGLIKDSGDYIINWRAVLRYIVSPKLHFELTVDKGINGRNVPESNGIGFFVRYNF